MSKVKKLPPRDKVKPEDTWDLTCLYESHEAWEQDLKKWERGLKKYEPFKGTLATDAATLAKLIKFDYDSDRRAERLAVYAFLHTAGDQSNTDYQRMLGRFQSIATKAAEAASFIQPEIMAIPQAKMKKFLASKELAPYKLALERVLRYKPYTLSDREEKLLAMQGEMAGAAGKAFRQLLDSDMKFGEVENEKGQRVELSNSTFSQFLVSPQRSVRKQAFHQYYEQFAGHKNTLAATLEGSIQKDVYYARARGYDSAIGKALHANNVPLAVYDSLIAAMRKHLPVLHHYYEVRRRKMKLRQIHHYDTYVPILADLEKNTPWKKAVGMVVEACAPLGDEYCAVLKEGLETARWCDRYPNQGKQSGAFSSGTFDGPPYIMMNYQPRVLDHVFTLAHEAGHSMHSHYSSKHQPYQYYQYTIFVAEVASTFNEQLLGAYMLERADSDQERAYLINRSLDAIRATVFRQTMFAEFEKITHEMSEAGEPLTIDTFRSVYRELLEAYFGPDFEIDDELSLECLRIPHFYRAFYVYQYATGLSAAIALSRRVLEGGPAELNDYLNFLKGGCSKFPLDLLRDAGVDMESPEPVETALTYFGEQVEELDRLL